MRFRLILPALGAAVLAVAPAQGVSFLEPGHGAVLEPGHQVVARWDAAPQDAREMELLLSLDGGATFALRLSAELDPAQRSFVWRVPSLPATEARVALRAEVSGREVLVAESADFVIAAPPERIGARQAVRREAGELWSMDAAPAAGQEPELPPALGPGAEDDPSGAQSVVAEFDAGAGAATVALRSASRGGGTRAVEPAPRPTARLRTRAAFVVPLRI